MAKDNFPQALRWVLQHEGFFVNHPKDPGGATNRGITQRTYDAFRRSRSETPRDVRAIEEAEVRQIYREQYADAVWFDRLPSGLDYALFDFAVNSGPARAVKALQNIVGVRTDGIMGNRTLAAVKAHDSGQVITLLCDARQRFVRSLRTYKTFGKGWERRIAEVERKGVTLAEGLIPPIPHLRAGRRRLTAGSRWLLPSAHPAVARARWRVWQARHWPLSQKPWKWHDRHRSWPILPVMRDWSGC